MVIFSQLPLFSLRKTFITTIKSRYPPTKIRLPIDDKPHRADWKEEIISNDDLRRIPISVHHPPGKILLLSSSHNSITQNIERKLLRLGYAVAFQTPESEAILEAAVLKYSPHLILCPTLKTRIPPTITEKVTCLIVHPGIVGDKGPWALDWAILNDLKVWGVTILQAGSSASMDSGDIWASAEFQMPLNATKTQLYNGEITRVATCLVLDVVQNYFNKKLHFVPEALNYTNPWVKGSLHPHLPQSHVNRVANWGEDGVGTIYKKMRAADGQPGLKAELILGDRKFVRYVYDGKPLKNLDRVFPNFSNFKDGQIFAKNGDDICIRTKDGAISIGQIRKPRNISGATGRYPTLKLPAVLELGVKNLVPDLSHLIEDRNIHYENYKNSSVGILTLHFYNGAMNRGHCVKVQKILQTISIYPQLKALIIRNTGPSNGIHLNVVEASPQPGLEAFNNLLEINQVVKTIILNFNNVLTVSALEGNVGAGGVFMGLATDFTFAKNNIVLNPHYKKMGLFGSELHTYTGMKRCGKAKLEFLKESAIPLSVEDAEEFRLIDKLEGEEKEEFLNNVVHFVEKYTKDDKRFDGFIKNKIQIRRCDESEKPLWVYEKEELEEMKRDMFENRNGFHEKRKMFVYKGYPPKV